MQSQIDISKHPYGLGGGTIISGSTGTNVFVGGEGFWYYPVTATTAIVVFNNSISGSGGYSISASFTSGNGVYGPITQVTQSAGIAILYSGPANEPRYTFNGR